MTVVTGVTRRGAGATRARKPVSVQQRTVWDDHEAESDGVKENFKASVSHATGLATSTTTAETGATRRAVTALSASRTLHSSATMDNASTSKQSIFSSVA